MGIFSKKEFVPPDVGAEEEFEEKNKDELKELEQSAVTQIPQESKQQGPAIAVPNAGIGSEVIERVNLEIEKFKTRLDFVTNTVREYSERMSLLSQQIGEIRTMNLETEKRLVQAIKDSASAIDIVKSVEPQKLRLDYQKSESRVEALTERLEGTKEFQETIMDEVKDLRRQSNVFIGTDGVLKLNDEIKKDLIEIQKVDSRVRINADKAEQLYIDLRRETSRNQKVVTMVSTLEAGFESLRAEVQRIRIDHSSIVKDREFGDFRKHVDEKFGEIKHALTLVGEIRGDNEKSKEIFQSTLALAKRNHEEIATMAMHVGEDKVKRVADYERWLAAVLKMMDQLASQMAEMKKRSGLTEEPVVESSLRDEIKTLVGEKKPEPTQEVLTDEILNEEKAAQKELEELKARS